jgi:DNA polymerase-3 subunit epsilon
MFWRLLGPELQRKWLLRRASPGALRDFLHQPFVSKRTDYREVEYVAIDLETTGFSPSREHILSIGLVVMNGVRIDLSTAEHIVLRTSLEIPEASAVIHQITDDRAAQGIGIGDAMPHLLRTLRGRVMIAHHAQIERGFLSAACVGLYGSRLPLPTVDTQALALRWFQQRNKPVKPQELRLHALRERYNLPRYPAHNALSDALAAAELFLAQAAERARGKGMALGEFMFQ